MNVAQPPSAVVIAVVRSQPGGGCATPNVMRRAIFVILFLVVLATPFALLRVDFAQPVWGAPAGSSGRWIFGIGQAF